MELGVCIVSRLVETGHNAQSKIRGSRGMCHLSRAAEYSLARFASSTGYATGVGFHGPRQFQSCELQQQCLYFNFLSPWLEDISAYRWAGWDNYRLRN